MEGCDKAKKMFFIKALHFFFFFFFFPKVAIQFEWNSRQCSIQTNLSLSVFCHLKISVLLWSLSAKIPDFSRVVPFPMNKYEWRSLQGIIKDRYNSAEQCCRGHNRLENVNALFKRRLDIRPRQTGSMQGVTEALSMSWHGPVGAKDMRRMDLASAATSIQAWRGRSLWIFGSRTYWCQRLPAMCARSHKL